MDGQHFDHLTRQLTTSLNRRRLTGVLAALGLAAGLGRSSQTEAKKGKKKKKKPKKCKDGAVKCGKACVNTKTNAMHCGRCGRRCGVDAACVDGACAGGDCPKDQCGTLCVDLQDNDDHCGSCGNDCQGDFTCIDGACSCAEGTKCGNQCVNTQTDNDHCGECDEPCLGATFCQGGVCLPCSPDCANKACGAPDGCGGACATESCAAGEACVAGQCQIACVAPTVDCSGICVNTETSAQHCGDCNHDCGTGRICVSGVCTCSPPCNDRETCCPGGCRDLRGCSPNTLGSCANGECGACGRVCSPGMFCCNNSTQLDPPPGTVGFCSDLSPVGFCPLP